MSIEYPLRSLVAGCFITGLLAEEDAVDEGTEPEDRKTIEILEKRYSPIRRAKSDWQAWSAVVLGLGLATFDTDESTVRSLRNIHWWLDRVGEADIFERLHAQSPLLPQTWQVIYGIRNEDLPDVIVNRLQQHKDKPYYREIQEELTVTLWMRLRNSLPTNEKIYDSMAETILASESLTAGLNNVRSSETASHATPASVSSSGIEVDAPTEPMVELPGVARRGQMDPVVTHAPDFTWMVIHGEPFQFKKGLQAQAITALFETWKSSGERDGCGMSEETLADKAGSNGSSFRVHRLFEGHPILKHYLRPASKGVWALHLALPPDGGQENTRRTDTSLDSSLTAPSAGSGHVDRKRTRPARGNGAPPPGSGKVAQG